MSNSQIDRLCHEWLQENYGEVIASEYTTYSLVIPMWNSLDLNNALEDFNSQLCCSFGSRQSFEDIGYYEAREKLGLPDERTPIPDIYIMAFATK